MKMIQFLLLVCVGALLLPGTSSADPAFAHVVIDNPTSTKIHYQLRWGDNAWKDMYLEAAHHMDHTYKYNPMGVLPPHISFVHAQGFEGGVSKSYKLDIGWDNAPVRYHFERNNRGELDLYKG